MYLPGPPAPILSVFTSFPSPLPPTLPLYFYEYINKLPTKARSQYKMLQVMLAQQKIQRKAKNDFMSFTKAVTGIPLMLLTSILLQLAPPSSLT